MQPLQARRLVSALRYLCWYDVYTGDNANAPWRVLRHVTEVTPSTGAGPVIARPVGDAGSLLLEYSEEALARMSESQLRDALRTLAAHVAATKTAIEAGADPFEIAAAQARSRASGPQYLPTAIQPEGTGDPVDLSEGAKNDRAPTGGTGSVTYAPTGAIGSSNGTGSLPSCWTPQKSAKRGCGGQSGRFSGTTSCSQRGPTTAVSRRSWPSTYLAASTARAFSFSARPCATCRPRTT